MLLAMLQDVRFGLSQQGKAEQLLLRELLLVLPLFARGKTELHTALPR